MTERPSPSWYRLTPDGAECELCFRGCRIARGERGACGVRGVDADGAFVSVYLGRYVSVALDPIEKKPFRHWLPGTVSLSLGSVGCTARCPFCQNHEISFPRRELPARQLSPIDMASMARSHGARSVSFTYNEPTLQAEMIAAASPFLRERDIQVAMVTNGLWSEEAGRVLVSACDAMNIDIKTFSEENYREIGGDLQTVLRNVEAASRAGVHVELTHLVVPGISDDLSDFDRLVLKIASIDSGMPLHITRYWPAYRYDALPTDVELLEKMERAARRRLARVHLGNV